MNWTLGFLILVLQASGAALQSQSQPPVQLPRSQMPDLGRPTKKDDTVPTFDFDQYFVGKWTFEWDVPDSPLGPAGRISGTEVYKPGTDGRFYESEYEGQSPQGPFKGRTIMIYHAKSKVISRYESDSRGFSLLKSGTIGGDLGGYFTIYYESAPFIYNGKLLRLKTTTQLLSPVHHKVRAQLSVDDGPFVSIGNPWWKKEVPGVTPGKD